MKIERLVDGYKLTDLYITAALLCEPGMTLVGVESAVDIRQKKFFMFIIKGDPEKIRLYVDAFFNGQCKVDPNLFKTKLQSLKSRVYANF